MIPNTDADLFSNDLTDEQKEMLYKRNQSVGEVAMLVATVGKSSLVTVDIVPIDLKPIDREKLKEFHNIVYNTATEVLGLEKPHTVTSCLNIQGDKRRAEVLERIKNKENETNKPNV